MLLTVGRRLARNLEPADTLARLGGDQFGAIVMAESASQLNEIIAAIRENLGTPISLGDREVSLRTSIGVAQFERERPRTGSELLKDAEVAMVNAKKAGGDCVVYFTPDMRAQRSDRLSLETDLRRALERNEIKLFFQPIVRLEDRTVAGFEAMLRWHHPRLGPLGAADFMRWPRKAG